MGDNTGDSINYLLDTAVSFRHLKTWNVAKTKDELTFYSTNSETTASTLNLMSYYKLTEIEPIVYEKLQTDWQFPTTPTYNWQTELFV